MKIRFEHVASLRLTFKPGDTIEARESSDELERLLACTRVDGQKVARLVEDDEIEVVLDAQGLGEEVADALAPALEYATTRRGRGGKRSAAVS